MSRQTPAHGSVYQRKDGYWAAALSVAGRRVVRYARTQREAREKLAALLADHRLGTLAPPASLTLDAWVDRWLATRAADLRPSTLATYRDVLGRVTARCGHVRLSRLSPALLAGVLADLRRTGMGARRVQMAYTYLHACLGQAAALGLLGYNPLDRVPKPRGEAQERRYWTAAEARRFLSAALRSSHQHAPLLAFLLGTGLRLSEALGLRWADVDLGAGVVHVRRALVWTGTGPVLGLPKTRQGERAVDLPAWCLDLLRRLPRPLSEEAPVFTAEGGATPTKSNVRRAMLRLCELAGVPYVHPHGLRHVHAALLVAGGLDPQSLRRRLGHAHVSMSLDRYAYPVRSDAAAVAALEAVLGA